MDALIAHMSDSCFDMQQPLQHAAQGCNQQHRDTLNANMNNNCFDTCSCALLSEGSHTLVLEQHSSIRARNSQI
eukprot:316834-Pelagomonas_calceolata.AAC.4